jgi:hypothetical protein
MICFCILQDEIQIYFTKKRVWLPRQAGIDPSENDCRGREYDGVKADRRHERRGRFRRFLFLASSNRFVDRTSVTHIIVRAQANDVFGVGL